MWQVLWKGNTSILQAALLIQTHPLGSPYALFSSSWKNKLCQCKGHCFHFPGVFFRFNYSDRFKSVQCWVLTRLELRWWPFLCWKSLDLSCDIGCISARLPEHHGCGMSWHHPSWLLNHRQFLGRGCPSSDVMGLSHLLCGFVCWGCAL